MNGKIRQVVTAVGLLGLFSVGVVAQAPRGGSDVLAQLLAEVHALRVVLERQAADTARIQLLTNRLTIQEARVTRLARDLDDVREQLSRGDVDEREAAEQLKRMETSLSHLSDAAQKEEFEQQVAMMRRQISEARAREQRLRTREGELESAFGAEQARWVEISNRLDELERSLARP